MSTKTRSSLPTLFVACAVVAAAALFFAGPIGGRDEGPRWLHLSVEFSPSPRTQPVIISYTINGAPGADIPPVTHSPWPPRDVAVHPGETLILRASQVTAGQLTCAVHERGRLVAHSSSDEPGIVHCVAPPK